MLTTQQAFELLFPSYHRARKRLLLLYDRGVLGRFRPPQRPGSQPFHYVLDERGAKLVAGYLGVELKELKFRTDRVLRLSRSPFLRHLRETNGFFGSGDVEVGLLLGAVVSACEGSGGRRAPGELWAHRLRQEGTTTARIDPHARTPG